MSAVQSDVARQGKVVVAGIIIGCAAIGYVAITWMADSSRKQSSISTLQTRSRGTPAPESEHYAQVLDRYNREKATAAEQNGDSYVSVLSSRANNVPDQQGGPQPAQYQAQGPAQFPQAPQQANYYQQPMQQAPRQDPVRAREIDEQAKGLLANWTPAPHGLARVSSDAAEYAKSIAQRDNGQTQQGGSAMPGAVKIVEDFALVPALLKTDIDTDENSLVRALVPSGPYEGAWVYATGYKLLTNTVDMTFTYMKWHGHSYKIQAKAVDQTSLRTALSGEVNNRYFTRIILPAIAMGIGRAGQLYEQASAQNIITPQGGVIQTYPEKPSASAVAGTIVGGIANQGGQVLANDASNMPIKQVLIPQNTTIGIQFIGPVLSSDELGAGPSGQAQQPQQAQQTQQALAGAEPMSVLSQPAAQPPRQNGPPTPQQYGGNPPGYGPQQFPPPGITIYPRY